MTFQADEKTAMLARAPKPGKMPDVTGWVMEEKLDGWRILALVCQDTVRYFGRSGMEYSGHTPELDRQLLRLPAGTLLDGEMTHPKGWRFVQTVLGSDEGQSNELQYMVFDILQWEGQNQRGICLKVRRSMLENLFDYFSLSSPQVKLIDQLEYNPESVEALIESGAEGAVVKDPKSHYVGGRRSSWLKLKVSSTMDMVVMGGIEGKGEKTGKLAVIQLGQYKAGVLTWRANAWGKIDLTEAALLDQLWKEGKLEGMVAEVSHLGIAHTGKFRAPIIERFRLDKKPEECVWAEDDGSWYQLG